MKKRWRYIIGGLLILLLGGVIAARLYLDVWLLRYVNNVLQNDIKGYTGSVEAISIDLYRGAYRIHRLKIDKKTGKLPVPFIAIETVDLSIQWSALFHGRVVSEIDMQKPVINFAVSASGESKQNGFGTDWNKPIRDLMPIDINRVTFNNGLLTYRDFSTSPKVNIYIHHMGGEIRNLRNVVDKTKTLPSTISVSGNSIGHGALHIDGKMNILKPVIDMLIDMQLENINLPALNDYSDAYAAINIKQGKLSVYSQISVLNGHLTGYIKPLATNVAIIDLRKADNPLQLAWEALVAAVVEIFTNQSEDQFATKIPLDGNLNDINTDIWPALTAIIENAFINAFKKGFDRDVPKPKEL